MQSGRVIRSAGLIGVLTLVSRVLGLLRDMLMAGLFGTSILMSAFVVAFRIPNLFRAFFGEGALSAAFIPVFVETKEKEGPEAAWAVARQVFILVALALTLLVALGLGGIEAALALGSFSEEKTLILRLTQVMLPYMIFICLAAVSMAALNAYHRFTMPAVTPSVLNLVWIGAALAAGACWADRPVRQIYLISFSIVLAGVLQWLVQAPALHRLGFRPGWPRQFWSPRLLRVLALMGPAALGQAVTRVNVLVDTFLAVWVGAWAPAALFFSERLIYLPLGLFATALSTVLLPVFSGQAARAEHAALRRTMNHSLRMLLFVMIPAAGGLLVLSQPIVQLIFEWRSFTPESTWYTAVALAFYAPGLLVFSLSKVFVPAFYALQDTRTPVRVGLFTVGLNILLSVVFLLTWPLRFKHAGIAAATVLAEACYGLVLAALLHRRLGSPGWNAIASSAARALLATAAMAAAAFWTNDRMGLLLFAEGWSPKLAQAGAVGTAIGAGLAVYAAAAWFLRCPEMREVAAALRRGAKRGTKGAETHED